MAPLCGFVVHPPSELSGGADMADLFFLALGGGAFVAFAVLAAALKGM
jgi:hypothetical protein